MAWFARAAAAEPRFSATAVVKNSLRFIPAFKPMLNEPMAAADPDANPSSYGRIVGNATPSRCDRGN
jgi:hypothetical protein